jgi:Protein of unknown function (DUF2695)
MQDCDPEVVELIAPDVMRVLDNLHFFQRLDDLLSPADESVNPACCRKTYELSEAILLTCDIDSSDLSDIFCVLQAQGGKCDCEILYNVSETNRLKHHYWTERSQGRTVDTKHSQKAT